MVETKPTVLVVLGMHRAGSSLTMRALHELGVDLGPGLAGGDEWCQESSWGLEAIERTHDAILERLDRRWEGSRGLLPMPPDWWRSAEIAPLRHELSEIARKGVACAVHAWGFKDSRTACLLPLWQDVFEDLGVEPLYVLNVRHPRAVADALSKRSGLADAQAQLLWLRCYLDALRHTEGRLSAVVEYERWLTDPGQQVATLAALLARPVPDAAESIERAAAHVKPEMCHHGHEGDAGLKPVVAELYELLRSAAERGGAFDGLREPDRLHQAATGLFEASAADPVTVIGAGAPQLVLR
jgi:hypothetical protein